MDENIEASIKLINIYKTKIFTRNLNLNLSQKMDSFISKFDS